MGMMVLALGIAVLFQFIILRVKWNKGHYADAAIDVLMLIILNSVFGGTILGVISATAGSTLISLYLIWKPIKLFEDSPETESDSSCTLTKEEKIAKSMMDKFDSLFD